MNKLALTAASALTVAAGTLGLSAPSQANAQIVVAACAATDACYSSQSPTPWSDSLTLADLTSLGLGTTQPLIADQTDCCVIRLGSLQIVFSTTGGPVTETAPEYNGDGSNGSVVVADYLIPVDATSAVISGTFGNSTIPNTSVETLYFGAASGVPEPAAWAMMLVGFGGLGAVMRRRRLATFA